jgi:predicted DNA-binding transcriptional regulator AlpA
MNTKEPDFLLDMPEVKRRFGIKSNQSVYSFMERGILPKSRKLGRKAMWSNQEITAALEAWKLAA